MAHCVTHGPPPSTMASSCAFLSAYLILLSFMCLFPSLFVPYTLFTFPSVLSSTRFVSFSLSPPLFLFESFWLVSSPRFWGPFYKFYLLRVLTFRCVSSPFLFPFILVAVALCFLAFSGPIRLWFHLLFFFFFFFLSCFFHPFHLLLYSL